LFLFLFLFFFFFVCCFFFCFVLFCFFVCNHCCVESFLTQQALNLYNISCIDVPLR
jgi:hypothetical protein